MSISTPTPAKRFRQTPTSRARFLNRRTSYGPRRTGTFQQQLRSLQNVVKNLAPEIKQKDIDIGAANIATTGSSTNLTAIAQGDNYDGRTGLAINVTSVALRGVFGYAADSPTSGIARFALVQALQQVTDTDATPSDVFDSSGSAVLALPNHNQVGKFKILWVSRPYDLRRLLLDSDVTSASTETNLLEYNWAGNIKVNFNGSASTDIEKNGIYFMILNDSTATLDFSGFARLSYTDV